MFYPLLKDKEKAVKMIEYLYRLIEKIDGEKIKGFKLLPYKIAQKIKMFLLTFIK
jgi:hypothetical protein